MRAFDRVLALVLALFGLAAGIVLVVEIAHRGLGNDGYLILDWPAAAEYLRTTPWSAAPVVLVGAVLLVLGLLLLVAELRPRRPGLLVLRPAAPDLLAAVPRRSVARTLEAAAATVPGVDGASSSVRGRKVTITARTGLHDSDRTRGQVDQRVADAVESLELLHPPKVSVRMRKAS